MSVSIRLKRMGRTNRPFYRVVVADTLKKREGAYLENLGWYDPLGKDKNYAINVDRISYWKSQGARISPTINSLVRKEGGYTAGKKTVVAAAVAPEPADLTETPAS